MGPGQWWVRPGPVPAQLVLFHDFVYRNGDPSYGWAEQ